MYNLCLLIYDSFLKNFHISCAFDDNRIKCEKENFQKALKAVCFKESKNSGKQIKEIIDKINRIGSECYSEIIQDLKGQLNQFALNKTER